MPMWEFVEKDGKAVKVGYPCGTNYLILQEAGRPERYCSLFTFEDAQRAAQYAIDHPRRPYVPQTKFKHTYVDAETNERFMIHPSKETMLAIYANPASPVQQELPFHD